MIANSKTGIDRGIYRSILDLVGNTPLLELKNINPNPNVKLYAKLEGQNPSGSVKDRIVKNMLLGALESDILKPGVTLIESTSGNTGISLALMANLMGYRFIAVMPDNLSLERRDIIAAYGAELVLTDGEKGTNGAIEVAHNLVAENPDFLMLDQYSNHDNPRAHYETTGVEILRDAGKVDVFVAGLGTGGTLMGVGKRLKETDPSTKIVAVQPYPHGGLQGLRNISDGYIPGIIDLNILDESVIVKDEDAFQATRDLLGKEGLFMGISSGAVVCEAIRQAEKLQAGMIVVLLADGGWKYLSERIWMDDPLAVSKRVKGVLW